MCRGLKIPWVAVQNTMDSGYDITWVRGQNIMDRGAK